MLLSSFLWYTAPSHPHVHSSAACTQSLCKITILSRSKWIWCSGYGTPLEVRNVRDSFLLTSFVTLSVLPDLSMTHALKIFPDDLYSFPQLYHSLQTWWFCTHSSIQLGLSHSIGSLIQVLLGHLQVSQHLQPNVSSYLVPSIVFRFIYSWGSEVFEVWLLDCVFLLVWSLNCFVEGNLKLEWVMSLRTAPRFPQTIIVFTGPQRTSSPKSSA